MQEYAKLRYAEWLLQNLRLSAQNLCFVSALSYYCYKSAPAVTLKNPTASERALSLI